ncbi:keratin, type I cytoskeletal 18-like [Piliocolobus tephrosceles]|uniref:keratin, type I cytoskeletal 18-like n=1 Tax=Piliocolobus tephrosceles TaxID=591936 RepID=UPI000C2A2041|nr:keratin, type I cytoskeletal 18-like [Piliocolobus tephrosceles]
MAHPGSEAAGLGISDLELRGAAQSSRRSMSFTICFTTSTNYQSLHSIQPHSHIIWSISSAGEVYAGLRGLGSHTSVSFSTSFWGGWGSGGLAAGMARGLEGMGDIQNEKDTMQGLSDCLAFLPGQSEDSGD